MTRNLWQPTYTRFKWEAKKCNFHNNAAMIWIFIWGLKNAYTLASWVYKKRPQTLANTISEAEKLQAAQQLTATLLPSLTVNVMSSEDDRCFQCQELGHMAHHCPHIKCFYCNEYGHITADCPDKILPSGTLVCHNKLHSHSRHHTRSTSRHCHRDRYRFSRNRSQSHTCRYQSHRCNNSHRSHSRSYHRHPHRAHHVINTQVLITINMTHHIEGHQHLEVPQLIPEITADLDHILHTDPVEWHLLNLHLALTKQHQNIRIGNIRVTNDDPQSDYYSLDDASSDSNDDLN